MSAWVVSKHHIDLLVTAGMQLGGNGRMWNPPRYDDDAQALGKALLGECIKSVSYRYPNDAPENLPGPVPCPTVEEYEFQNYPGLAWHQPATVAQLVTILKAIDCYEYQTCEHPTWEESEAKKYCSALRAAIISHLPGWNDAGWGIDDRQAFSTLKVANA